MSTGPVVLTEGLIRKALVQIRTQRAVLAARIRVAKDESRALGYCVCGDRTGVASLVGGRCMICGQPAEFLP